MGEVTYWERQATVGGQGLGRKIAPPLKAARGLSGVPPRGHGASALRVPVTRV